MTKHLLCSYAAYSIMPHTSLEKSSTARSSVRTVPIPAGAATADSARSGSVAEEEDSLCIDNGILLVNFSKATGHMVALTNRQAKVGCSAVMRSRVMNWRPLLSPFRMCLTSLSELCALRMLEPFADSVQGVFHKLGWHQRMCTADIFIQWHKYNMSWHFRWPCLSSLDSSMVHCHPGEPLLTLGFGPGCEH